MSKDDQKRSRRRMERQKLRRDRALKPWYRRGWAQAVGLVLLVCLAWRLDAAGTWCRSFAKASLRRHAPASTLSWLDKTRTFSLSPAKDELLEARLWLSLNQNALAQAALERAELAGLAAPLRTSYQRLVDLQRGDLSQASILLEGDPNLEPGELFEALARSALLSGDVASTQRIIDQWNSAQPSDAGPEYYRGRAREVLEDYAAAAEHYARAVGRSATLAKARYRLSKMRQVLLDYESALVPLESDTERYQALFDIERAECLYQLDEFTAAQAAIAGHLDTPPYELNSLCYELDDFQEWDRAKAIAGKIALQLGRTQKAIELWQSALAFNHRDFATVFQLQQALREEGQTEKADQWLERHRAMLIARQEIGVLRKQIADDPNDMKIRLELAKILYQGESLAETQSELQSILAIDPSYKPAHALLARVYDEKARYDATAQYLSDKHKELSR